MDLDLREAWVGVRIRVVAKQMAAGVWGRNDIIQRLLAQRTTALLRNRSRGSLGEACHLGHPIGALPPGPWGHLLSSNPAEMF